MNDIRTIYKKSIGNIIIPQYSMESIQQGEQHRKFRRNLLLFRLCSSVIILIITAIISSGTAYAVHMIQRHIHITQTGSKIDSAGILKSAEIDYVQDSSSLAHLYETHNQKPLQESEKDKFVTEEYIKIPGEAKNAWFFTNWENAQEVVPFEIIYPNLSSINYDTIFYQNIDSSRKLIQAEGEDESRSIKYEILYFSNINWDFEIEHNGTTENYRNYVNVHGYEFMLYDVELEDDNFTYVSIALPQYLIQMYFEGYSPLEIETVLNELDYSNYNM